MTGGGRPETLSGSCRSANPTRRLRAAALEALVITRPPRHGRRRARVSPADLYMLLPKGRAARTARPGSRHEFRFLCDPRTSTSPAARSSVSPFAGVVLPDWLATVLADDLHFSPVTRVGDAGEREVFDVSVPTTHAFVGNGIVNHNTVNMPEEATVEDVEELYIESWRLGLKAVALYRDNCKVGQPLSTQKKAGDAARASATRGRADRRDDHRAGAGPPEAAAHAHVARRSRSGSPTATAT